MCRHVTWRIVSLSCDWLWPARPCWLSSVQALCLWPDSLLLWHASLQSRRRHSVGCWCCPSCSELSLSQISSTWFDLLSPPRRGVAQITRIMHPGLTDSQALATRSVKSAFGLGPKDCHQRTSANARSSCALSKPCALTCSTQHTPDSHVLFISRALEA